MKIWHFSIFLLMILFSCENEPVDRIPANVIAVDSELYNLIQRAAGNGFESGLTCIDFNYAFTLLVYNEEMDVIAEQIIWNDIEFSDFLGGLEEGKSISLSYPITSVLNNGQPYQINNNKELKIALDRCVEADVINICNNILTETSCIWKVTHVSGPNTQYEGTFFQVSSTGNVGLHFQDHSFGGTWITYLMEDKLHLNIFITGDEEISTNWNFDWKVVDFTNSEMVINNGIDEFLLGKDCIEPCRQFLFEECETEPGSGIAIFDLESYVECFLPFMEISDPTTVTWNFYTSEDDIMAGINPIVNIMFSNEMNPQIIYVGFHDRITGELVARTSIILKAINCS